MDVLEGFLIVEWRSHKNNSTTDTSLEIYNILSIIRNIVHGIVYLTLG
jgi:hypothetical protein